MGPGWKLQAVRTNPVCEVAVICAVLAHGRDDEAVRQRDTSNCQGMEEGGCLGWVLGVEIEGCAGWGFLSRSVKGHAFSRLAGGFLVERGHGGWWMVDGGWWGLVRKVK